MIKTFIFALTPDDILFFFSRIEAVGFGCGSNGQTRTKGNQDVEIKTQFVTQSPSRGTSGASGWPFFSQL